MPTTTESVCFRSSRNFDGSCSSSDSSTDALWSDIDLAERCLVSNLFEDAANLSSTTLRRLCASRCSDNAIEEICFHLPCSSKEGQDDDQRKSPETMEMIEAAGMVLIQAQNELDRADELTNVLISHFGHVTNVPPSLYVTGISLQVSAGFVLSSRSYVEEFLEYWALQQDGECYPNNQRGRMFVADLAEIYAVHMLERGCMDPESALKWVQGTNLLSERKKAILEKLHALSLQKLISSTTVSDHGTNSNTNSQYATMNGHALGQTRLTATENTGKGKVDGLSACQSQQDQVAKVSKVLPIRFHILTNSSLMELVRRLVKLFSERFNVWCSNLPYADKASIRGRHVAGVATVVLFYALFKERYFIKRTMKTYLKHVKSGLGDFCQLAFGLQISPLVASQALPVSSR